MAETGKPPDAQHAGPRIGGHRVDLDWVIEWLILFPLAMVEALVGGIIFKIRGGRRGG